MRSLITKQAERFLRERKNYKRWLAAFLCLAVMVVLGTVMVLRYTGTAMTGDPQCGLEEHVHSEACYQENLICGKEAEEGHEHTAECYEKQLVCEAEEHTHADACYEKDEEITVEMDAQDGEGAVAEVDTQTENGVQTETVEATVEGNPKENSVADTGETTAPVEEGTEPVETAVKDLSQTVETEHYIVTVSYSAEANLPEEAELRVVEYSEDSERFQQRAEELGYVPDMLLNVGFFVGEEEVEPATAVDVKIAMKGQEAVPEYNIVHFGDQGVEDLESTGGIDENGNASAEFGLDSFSDIGIKAVPEAREGDTDPGLLEVAPVSGLAHEKYIKDNGDGTYDLTVNVKGAVASAGKKAELDIIFVVDTSGSMAWDVNGKSNTWNPSRLSLARQSIQNLVDDLDQEEGIAARYKLITFSNSAVTRRAESWYTGTAIKSYLPSDATGGTNYESALKAVNSALSNKNSNASTIVLFLTDGSPTSYDGDRTNTGSYTNLNDISKAATAAGDITCDYFFAVGYGAGMTGNVKVYNNNNRLNKTVSGKEILDEVVAPVNAIKDVSTTTDLDNYFENFKNSLKKIRAVDVSFTDTLSDEVELVSGTNLKTEVRDANGNLVPEEELSAAGLTASFDEANKTMSASMSAGYELKQDYTYSVTMTIKPNEGAEQKYKDNGYAYPNIGEADTDAPDNATSSGKGGIFSNAGATVSYFYMVNGEKFEHEDLTYPKPVVQLPKETQPLPEPEAPDLQNHKYIKYNEESDTYDLTLDVVGQVETGSTGSKYDILFVVDESGSMKGDLIRDAKNAITNLIDELSKNTSNDIMYNLIGFSDSAKPETKWKNAAGMKNALDLSADGGTNYQDALYKASIAINSEGSRSDATKVVIFLTDGVPTYHLCMNWGWRLLVGNYCKGCNPANTGTAARGGGGSTEKEDFEGAKRGAEALAGNCHYFYAIGFGNEMENGEGNHNNMTGHQILDVIVDTVTVPEGNQKKAIMAATAGDLNEQFDIIAGEIKSFTCTNVKITDELSTYVDVNPNSQMIIKVMDGKKEVASGTGSLDTTTEVTVEDKTITASYSKEEKKLVLDLGSDYELANGYTYSITITNLKTSDKAYEEYRATGDYPKDAEGNYLYVGGENTDAEGNHTSENEEGFWSNNNAYLEYTYNGEEKLTKEYPKPVVQVKPAKLTVTKVFAGQLTDEERQEIVKSLQFILDGTNSDGDRTTVSQGLPQNGAYTVTFDNLIPGKEYTLSEINHLVENYDVEAVISEGDKVLADGKIVLQPEETKNITVTNTYEKNVQSIRILKTGESGGLNGAVFGVSRLKGDEEIYLGEWISDNHKGEDGVIFEGMLEIGKYKLVESEAPDGYNKLENPIVIDVSSDRVLVEGDNKMVSIDKDGVIRISNTTGYELPKAGGPGTLLYTFGGLAILAISLVYGFGMKRKKERGYH